MSQLLWVRSPVAAHLELLAPGASQVTAESLARAVTPAWPGSPLPTRSHCLCWDIRFFPCGLFSGRRQHGRWLLAEQVRPRVRKDTQRGHHSLLYVILGVTWLHGRQSLLVKKGHWFHAVLTEGDRTEQGTAGRCWRGPGLGCPSQPAPRG